MDIVEIRFIKNTQSVLTGNEYYQAGTTANFFAPQSNALVEQGRAVPTRPEVSKATPEQTHTPAPEPPDPVPDYSKMKVKELRALAKEAGVVGAAKMKKADLITVLEK